MKSSQFRQPTQKRSQVRCSHEDQVIFGQHTKTKPIWTTHTNTKSIDPQTRNKSVSILKLKPGTFRPAHKNEVDCDPCTKNKAYSFPKLKSSHFRSRTQKPSWISTLSLTSSQFRCSDTKTQLISILTLKTSHFRTLGKSKSMPMH